MMKRKYTREEFLMRKEARSFQRKQQDALRIANGSVTEKRKRRQPEERTEVAENGPVAE